MNHLLDIVILLPLVGFLVTLFIPRSNPAAVRTFTVAWALITFLLSLGLALGFNSDAAGLQFETNFVWLASPQINYHVGIDGISLWLIILSTFLTPIAIMVSWRAIQDRGPKNSTPSCCSSNSAWSAYSRLATCSCSTCSGKSPSCPCTS